jgi:hypothetical protein
LTDVQEWEFSYPAIVQLPRAAPDAPTRVVVAYTAASTSYSYTPGKANPTRVLTYHGIQTAVVTLDVPRLAVLKGTPTISQGALKLSLGSSGACVAVQQPRLPVTRGTPAAFAVEMDFHVDAAAAVLEALDGGAAGGRELRLLTVRGDGTGGGADSLATVALTVTTVSQLSQLQVRHAARSGTQHPLQRV